MQNSECNVQKKSLDVFFFGMNSDVPVFEVHVFVSDFEFWAGVYEC